MTTRLLTIADLGALQELARLGQAEGFRFLRRFVDELAAERTRYRRRAGLGRTLVKHLEARARPCYALLRLRTDSPAARRQPDER
jgi:hypothetical protein